jgi:hypothetical protein
MFDIKSTLRRELIHVINIPLSHHLCDLPRTSGTNGGVVPGVRRSEALQDS